MLGIMSWAVAPISLIRTNPWMPKVEGKSHDTDCHHHEILLWGHESPEINSRGTEANTMMRITFSRYLTTLVTVIAKKMQAMMNGRSNATISHGRAI